MEHIGLGQSTVNTDRGSVSMATLVLEIYLNMIFSLADLVTDATPPGTETHHPSSCPSHRALQERTCIKEIYVHEN